MAKRNYSNRLWEIDFLRGVAIIMMIIFHFVWNLSAFGFYLDTRSLISSPWQIFARCTGALFVFVMGISLTLSYHQAVQTTGRTTLLIKFMKRGMQIFGVGMVITLVLHFSGTGRVIFGILHLIGVAIILSYPLLKAPRRIILLLAIIIIAAGFYISRFWIGTFWFIPLGFKMKGLSMSDYYPLLPWYGFTLLGIYAGDLFYAGGARKFRLPDIGENFIVRKVRFLGRHSLVIYLVHQPLLYGAVCLYAYLFFNVF